MQWKGAILSKNTIEPSSGMRIRAPNYEGGGIGSEVHTWGSREVLYAAKEQRLVEILVEY